VEVVAANLDCGSCALRASTCLELVARVCVLLLALAGRRRDRADVSGMDASGRSPGAPTQKLDLHLSVIATGMTLDSGTSAPAGQDSSAMASGGGGGVRLFCCSLRQPSCTLCAASASSRRPRSASASCISSVVGAWIGLFGCAKRSTLRSRALQVNNVHSHAMAKVCIAFTLACD
jgi:hypothetical protein